MSLPRRRNVNNGFANIALRWAARCIVRTLNAERKRSDGGDARLHRHRQKLRAASFASVGADSVASACGIESGSDLHPAGAAHLNGRKTRQPVRAVPETKNPIRCRIRGLRNLASHGERCACDLQPFDLGQWHCTYSGASCRPPPLSKRRHNFCKLTSSCRRGIRCNLVIMTTANVLA